MKYVRWVTYNFGWKMMAVVISFGLWLWLVGQFDVGATVPATVQFRNLPHDLEVTSEATEKFYVKVRGPAGRLNQESLAGTQIILDFASVQHAGEQTFALTQGNVILPPGVTLDGVVPSQIRLRFETRVTREVPVEVHFAGPAPEGYRIASQTATPERIKITGPRSHVESIHSVETDPIDLSGTISNAEFRSAVYIPDPHVRCEDCGPVTVHIQLEKILGSSQLNK